MITYKESLKWRAREEAFLNTIDLKQFIKTLDTNELYNIMDAIENKYNKQYQEEPFIFNCMDASEFIEYLQKRYPKEIQYIEKETISYFLDFK